MRENNSFSEGRKIIKNTIIGNILLAIIKLVIGVIARSKAMIADGVHSLSDIISSVAVIIGLKLASQPNDESHPYGHEKIEPIMSKLLAIILLITAIGIGYSGIKIIINGNYIQPGAIAIVGAVISIVVKEWMYRYTKSSAKKIGSTAMEADAWHHRSDALSSVGTLIGIVGARLGFPVLDPLAAVIVSLLIIKASIEIYLQATNQLIDKSADEEIINKINELIINTNGVEKLDILKTRMHANLIYVDVEISINGKMTVEEGHMIAEEVHHKIENMGERVKHCMVHVNPYK